MTKLRRRNKDGSLDKRFKVKEETVKEKPQSLGESPQYTLIEPVDNLPEPNELYKKFLKDNNLDSEFVVLEGTFATKYGVIKLEKQLALTHKYV